MLTKHQSAPVPPLHRPASGTPRELDQLIATMLAKTPEERPTSMTAVDATLGTCQTLVPSATMHDTLPEATTLVDWPPPASDRIAPVPLPEAPTLPAPAPAPAPADSTMSEATSVRLPRQPKQPNPMRLLAVILGGLVFGGLVTFLALRSARHEPVPPTAPAAADASIASADAASVVSAASAEAGVPEAGAVGTGAPDAEEPPPDAAVTMPSGASELEVECLRYQANQQWGDLDTCADQLKTANPALSKELKNRALLETRAVSRVNAFEAALRDKNLKKARSELDGLAATTGYAKLRGRYEQAEQAAIQEVAQRLERAKDSDCKEYNQILQQERVSKPPRVAAEAARQVKCTPAPAPGTCDHAELAEKGMSQYGLGQLAASLASYEAAYNRKQTMDYAEKTFIIACNLPHLAKARLFWRRLSADRKARVLGICVRNGVTEEMLNAP